MRAFIYSAALYCEPCGEAIRERLPLPAGAELGNESSYDSDAYPKGPYDDGGGEADCPQHCDACGRFLENPLTPHGVAYVAEAVAEARARSSAVVAEWRAFYADALEAA